MQTVRPTNSLDNIEVKINSKKSVTLAVSFTEHAIVRMHERGINKNMVLAALISGEDIVGDIGTLRVLEGIWVAYDFSPLGGIVVITVWEHLEKGK